MRMVLWNSPALNRDFPVSGNSVRRLFSHPFCIGRLCKRICNIGPSADGMHNRPVIPAPMQKFFIASMERIWRKGMW